LHDAYKGKDFFAVLYLEIKFLSIRLPTLSGKKNQRRIIRGHHWEEKRNVGLSANGLGRKKSVSDYPPTAFLEKNQRKFFRRQ
jgi:hypothetical protein